MQMDVYSTCKYLGQSTNITGKIKTKLATLAPQCQSITLSSGKMKRTQSRNGSNFLFHIIHLIARLSAPTTGSDRESYISMLFKCLQDLRNVLDSPGGYDDKCGVFRHSIHFPLWHGEHPAYNLMSNVKEYSRSADALD